MPDDEDIITDVIRREGSSTNDPNDRGRRTSFGISERANPAAWADGNVTEEEARAIYEAKYLVGPGWNKLKNEKLRATCVDWSVTSGPQLVIMALQGVVETTPDGILGPLTVVAVNAADARLVNNQMVAAHVKMIGRLVQKRPEQLKFLSGWLARALDFLV